MVNIRWITALACAGGLGVAWGGTGSWTSSGPYGGGVTVLKLYEASPSTIWAAGRGGVFRSLSGGSSWARIELGLPPVHYATALAAATTAPVLYLGSGTQIFRSGNGGDLWIPAASPSATDAVIDLSLRRSSTNAVAAATPYSLFVSGDGGASWSAPGATIALSAGTRFSVIDYAADGTLYAGLQNADPAVFGGAIVLKSTTGGASWAPLSGPSSIFGATRLVSAPSNGQRLFVTDQSSIATSGNGGSTWTALALPASPSCGQVLSITAHPSIANALFVGCRNRGLLYSADASIATPTWITYNEVNGLSANGVTFAQINTLAIHPNFATTPTAYAGATDGGLLQTVNGGTNWTAINTGYQSINIRAIATHPIDSGAAARFLAGFGDSFTTTHPLYKSPDNGATWSLSDTGLNAEQIRSISIDPTTVDTDPFTSENFTVYAAGRSERIPANADKDGGIYKSTNAGASWTSIDSGIALNATGRPDMGTVRSVVLDPRSCASPPPTGPCPIGGPLQVIVATGGGRPDLSAPGLPYLAARVYKSANAGTSWTASESGLPLPQDLGPVGSGNYVYSGAVPLVFDPSNSQILYIGTFIGWSPGIVGATDPTLQNGVFKSVNGGATWVHASNGMPRVAGVGSSNWDVLALAINRANPQILYAAVNYLYTGTPSGHVYKTTDGGANWVNASTGIAGQDVRALFVDPNDPTGDTVYAGTGGDGANPGGVFRTTNGGAIWNSISLGLPADAATALAMPPRAVGAAARILAGTSAGVWDYTATADEDADGAPTAIENGVVAGDGNGDGTPDATQPAAASLGSGGSFRPAGPQTSGTVSVWIPTGGTCTQLNDSAALAATLYPPDSIAGPSSHDATGMVSFALPNCAGATVRVRFHGQNFSTNWTWRNYGPRIPGNGASFGWYRFSGARLIDAQTWELTIDAARQGNYRADPNDILFVGGPANSSDLLFENGFQ
ncbi:MAG: YCF48-related protein [Tahibacter sp.]